MDTIRQNFQEGSTNKYLLKRNQEEANQIPRNNQETKSKICHESMQKDPLFRTWTAI